MPLHQSSQGSSAFAIIPSLFPKSSPYIMDHTWTLFAAATILAFGMLTQERLDELVFVLIEATRGTPSKTNLVDAGVGSMVETKTITAIRQFREGLLKSGPIVGFPRSINALSFLQRHLDRNAPELSAIIKADQSVRASIPLPERQSRGRAFFDSIYTKHSDKILKNLNESSGGDLGEFAVKSLYGDLIAETSILGSKETGLLQFVCCLALGSECGPQAKGHMYGARNLGNSGVEIKAAISSVALIADILGVTWAKEDMGFLEIVDHW